MRGGNGYLGPFSVLQMTGRYSLKSGGASFAWEIKIHVFVQDLIVDAGRQDLHRRLDKFQPCLCMSAANVPASCRDSMVVLGRTQVEAVVCALNASSSILLDSSSANAL